MSAARAAGARRFVGVLAVVGRRGARATVAVVLTRETPAARWLRARVAPPLHSPAEHLRLALEELGTTFVKLGQILSTRGDILPPQYQAELARLQDAEPAEPAAAIRAVVEEELAQPLTSLYATFDPEPLAAASIGQAHTAVTREGLEVVVKVRRPGVVAAVESDLAVLDHLARWIARWTPFGRGHDLVGLTHEFEQTLRAELDYVKEARNAERFAANFAGDPTVHIPQVVWGLTTHRVLTLERIRGMKVTDAAAIGAAGLDRPELARRAATIEMKMIFEDGFFHADPHPGNFFIEPDGRIGLIDFGMVGTIDSSARLGLLQVIAALVTRDGDKLVDAIEALGITGATLVRDRLRADLLDFAARYLEQPLGEVSLGLLLRDLLGVVRRHKLRLPPNLALLVKTIGMSEGVGAQLDPSFRIVSVLLPFVQHLAPGPLAS